MPDYPLQHIANIATIFAQKGIKKVVVSPGSRCAPLTLAFVRHPDIEVFTISDERTAAFIALGMAQNLQCPVALVCTSGTAALNHAPAITEAYYQQIPLIVLTADRPVEWVDQADGQTIRQERLHANHIKANYSLPVTCAHPDELWHAERIISEAINTAQSTPAAPVHINVPIREPFYPTENEAFNYSKPVKIIEEIESQQIFSEKTWTQLINTINSYEKVLIVAGQTSHNEALRTLLASLPFPITADIISNCQGLPNASRHHDLWLSQPEKYSHLAPDLIITFGNSLISKNLKLFFRKYKPKAHWHIQSAGTAADTFQSLSQVLRVKTEYFFEEVSKRVGKNSKRQEYRANWLEKDRLITHQIKDFFPKEPFSELEAIFEVMRSLPTQVNLHLANSMTVRYANFIGTTDNQSFKIFSNRGTSGIDGCTSTAVGHALADPSTINVLITGDLAFFYDRNAFWHNYRLPNLKIFLLNNHGGVIFRMLDGSGRQPELEEYFETKQRLTAQGTAIDFGTRYFHAEDAHSFATLVDHWIDETQKTAILEIETQTRTNKEMMGIFKSAMLKD